MRGVAKVAGAALLLSGCAMARTPYVAVAEHELRPAEQTKPVEAQLEPQFVVVGPEGEARAAQPAPARGGFPEAVWEWPLEHLKASARFPDPFMGPEIYPEISVGSSTVAAHVVGTREVEFLNALDLSFYWLSLELPVIGTLDGSQPQPHLGLDLKVPFALPGTSSHWLALLYGASISDAVPRLVDSSRAGLMWGYGGQLLSAQLRVGYGYSQTFASSPLRQGLLYGALLGLNLGKVQPLVEVDGVRFHSRGDQLTILPGLRFLPAELPTLQLGVSGLVGLTFNDQTLSNRYGAIFEVGYNFL